MSPTEQMAQFQSYVATELGLARETLVAYARDVTQFLSFNGNRSFSARAVEEYTGHLLASGFKASTVKRKCASVRCLYRCLRDRGELAPRHLELIDSVRAKRDNLPSLDNGELERLFAAVHGPNALRDRAIVHVLSGSGLRASELCGLTIDDCRLADRSLRVRGKGGKDRSVPLSAAAAQAVAAYLAERGDGQRGARLFVQRGNGCPITRRAVTNMLTALSCRAGILHTSAHTLRRTCATSLLQAGMELDLVRRLLGHADLSATQRYLNITDRQKTAVCRRCHPSWAAKVNP